MKKKIFLLIGLIVALLAAIEITTEGVLMLAHRFIVAGIIFIAIAAIIYALAIPALVGTIKAFKNKQEVRKEIIFALSSSIAVFLLYAYYSFTFIVRGIKEPDTFGIDLVIFSVVFYLGIGAICLAFTILALVTKGTSQKKEKELN